MATTMEEFLALTDSGVGGTQPDLDQLRSLPEFQAREKTLDSVRQLLEAQASQPVQSATGNTAQSLAGLANFLKGGALTLPKQKREFNDKALKSLLALSEAEDKSLQTALKGIKSKGGDKFSRAQGLKIEKEFTDRGEKIMKEVNETIGGLDSLEGALRSGNPAQISATMSKAARVISGEVGVLTDKDVGRILPSTLAKDVKSLVTYLTSRTEQNLDPAAFDSLRMLTLKAKKNIADRSIDKFSNLSNVFKARNTSGANITGIGSAYVGNIGKLRDGANDSYADFLIERSNRGIAVDPADMDEEMDAIINRKLDEREEAAAAAAAAGGQ